MGIVKFCWLAAVLDENSRRRGKNGTHGYLVRRSLPCDWRLSTDGGPGDALVAC